MTDQTKPRVRAWLLASACVMLLTAAAHTLGTLQTPKPENPDQARLFETMATVRLALPMAPDRTMQELSTGFSWLMSIHCLTLGLVGVVVALGIRTGPGVRGLTLVIAAALALCTVVSVLFFFIVPTVAFGLALILAVLSLLLDPRSA